MKTILEIIQSICISSVVIGAIWLILPTGSMGKTMRYVVGVVFLLLIITPIAKNLHKIELSEASQTIALQSENLSSRVSEQSLGVSKAAAKRIIADILTARGILYREIWVEMDISDSYCISISRVEITLEKGEDHDAALKCIKSELGIWDVLIRE